MRNAFADQVVFITGASSGIGAALAREFSRQGAKVVLAARRKERLEQLAAELGAADKRALAVTCDVTQDADVQQALAQAVQAFGRLDVVVANAGIGASGKFERVPDADYRRVMETNVFGVLRTVRASLDELKKTHGRIAIIGSVSGYLASPSSSAYCMSKFAVRALAQTLRYELAPHGVSVTHIAPGFVASEIRLKETGGEVRPGAKDPAPPWLVMPTEKAARQIVSAIARRKRERIITFHGKLGVFLQRYFPRTLDWAMRRAARS